VTTEAFKLEGKCLCGGTGWRFSGLIEKVTACNCTACRRYGGLWAYGWVGENVEFFGESKSYVRTDLDEPYLANQFCGTCGNLNSWRGLAPNENGKIRCAVNLRLTDLAPIADLPIRHFDGHDKWEDLPMDGRTVKDHWF
jgi:hypothetical protein